MKNARVVLLGLPLVVCVFAGAACTKKASAPREPAATSSPRAGISCAGGFKIPGDVPFTPGISLADVLAKAGGLTETANRSKVKVARQKSVGLKADGESKTFTVDCTSDAAAKAFHLEPGDVVYVPFESP